jgi:hypothetical protein
MPQCRIGSSVVTVDSPSDCNAAGGTLVGNDGGAGGAGRGGGICFVRNVLTRAIGGLILDVGSSDAVSADTIEILNILSKSGKLKSGKKTIKLTPRLRRNLATRASMCILNLATTYQTMLDFRDKLLLTTERGRELKANYDRYLNQIYDVACQSNRLVSDSATTWLSVYPFVKEMVRIADAAEGRNSKSTPKLVSQSYRRCEDLIRRFRDGSNDDGFRELLGELAKELKGYEGLTATQAVDRLRKSTTHS